MPCGRLVRSTSLPADVVFVVVVGFCFYFLFWSAVSLRSRARNQHIDHMTVNWCATGCTHKAQQLSHTQLIILFYIVGHPNAIGERWVCVLCARTVAIGRSELCVRVYECEFFSLSLHFNRVEFRKREMLSAMDDKWIQQNRCVLSNKYVVDCLMSIQSSTTITGPILFL